MKELEVFSFSLTGNDPRYLSGVLPNAQSIYRYNQDAEFHLHIDDTVDFLSFENDLRSTVKTKIIHWTRNESLECHFWRFASVDLDNPALVHVRDIDSLFCERDSFLCQYIKNSGIKAYAIRDHYWHDPARIPFPVLGGMWGIHSKVLPYNFSNLVHWWVQNKKPFERFADMWFLQRYVYPYILRQGKVFSSIDVGSKWPCEHFPQNAPQGNIGIVRW